MNHEATEYGLDPTRRTTRSHKWKQNIVMGELFQHSPSTLQQIPFLACFQQQHVIFLARQCFIILKHCRNPGVIGWFWFPHVQRTVDMNGLQSFRKVIEKRFLYVQWRHSWLLNIHVRTQIIFTGEQERNHLVIKKYINASRLPNEEQFGQSSGWQIFKYVPWCKWTPSF